MPNKKGAKKIIISVRGKDTEYMSHEVMSNVPAKSNQYQSSARYHYLPQQTAEFLAVPPYSLVVH